MSNSSNSLKTPSKTLGVLGGMGPAAGAEFLRLLAKDAPARSDQEHPRLLLISESSVPDRSAAIHASLNGLSLAPSDDPTILLRSSLDRLIEWGADILAVPCNTAHFFIDKFRVELTKPLVHIVEATVAAAASASPGGAWLLSTSGTRASGIYPAYAKTVGYRFREPSDAEQGRADKSLRLVKSGDIPEAGKVLREVVEELWSQEDIPVVTACTELPLAYSVSGLPAKREISSLKALSDACLRVLYS
ncbi:aspartate racemase [Synergistales bacterium]|nr:aspartate racemase [Synergistales bacterium]